MRNIQPPADLPQNVLFENFESMHWCYTQLTPAALRSLEEGWQGVFRRTVLKSLPAEKIGENFNPDQGRPTKEIYSMIGLLLIAEFKQWTAEEAAQAYALDAGVQYALNLPRDRQYLSPRCFETYKQLLREGDEQCAEIFGIVTANLIKELGINIKKQRLDSTHIFSFMAKLGRTQLMATAIKRFLTQVLRHAKEAHAALPAELVARYSPAESRIFGYGKAAEGEYEQRIQQLAEDLNYLIETFASNKAINTRPSYIAIQRIFNDQCEITPATGKDKPAKVEVKAKGTDSNGQTSNVMQNPSDPEAGYDGHKGEGYQLQLAQSYGEDNEVNLITGCLPQSAAESDSDSLVPLLESQEDYDLTPEEVLADTAYGSDANVEACKEAGIELISPVPGKKAKKEEGNQDPDATDATSEADTKAKRLEERRREEQTEEWKKKYRQRSGIEGVNRALDRTTGIKELVVRGEKSVNMALYLKVTGFNILQAGRSYARKGVQARKTAIKASQEARMEAKAA